MHSTTILGEILAAGVTPTPGLEANTPDWLKAGAIVGLLIFAGSIITILVGLHMMKDAKKVNTPEQAKTGLNVGIAWLVVGLGIAGTFLTIATGTATYFINQG